MRRAVLPKRFSASTLPANTSESIVAIPPAATAVNVHVPPVVPAAERGVGNYAVLAEIPLAGHGTLVGERRIVFHVLDEGERIGLEAATSILDVELLGAGVIVELEEPELDVLTFTVGHRVHNRPVRILFSTSCVKCLLKGLVAVDSAHQTDKHSAHHFDELAERSEEHHSEIVGPEDALDSFGVELVAMLARRGTELVDQIIDLSVGHTFLFGCSHGLIHGVILSFSFTLCGYFAIRHIRHNNTPL